MSKKEKSARVDKSVMALVKDMQSAGFGSAAQFGTEWVEAMSDLGSEVLSFVSDRVKEDVNTQHALLHAKDIGEVQNIQAEFLQKAVDQYTSETGKLVEMSKELLPGFPGKVIMAD